MTKNFHHLSIAFIGLISLGLIAGCEHEAQKSDPFGTNDTKKPTTTTTTPANNTFVGTWKLTSTTDGTSWFAIFDKGGTWKISDHANGSGQRVYGSYTVNGANLSGNMINPGVGTGNIVATISKGVMTFDFVEHWHTPYKTIRYRGSKL